MSSDADRLERAMLLLECQEAEDALQHLRVRIGKLSVPFARVARWMELAQDPPPNESDWQMIDRFVRANLEAFRSAIDLSPAVAAMDEVAELQIRVNKLRQRKDSLGLK
jgi:hypothetical protein